ncbi:hypothetical protein TNCV_2740251 [Trichonephila clavipes]|nr:hypothetical protein TNCV_2740251 [Trichonephila clavipes]
MHLQTSMSSPGFKPRPYGTAVSVANHYTRWVTEYCESDGNRQTGRPSSYHQMLRWVAVHITKTTLLEWRSLAHEIGSAAQTFVSPCTIQCRLQQRGTSPSCTLCSNYL